MKRLSVATRAFLKELAPPFLVKIYRALRRRWGPSDEGLVYAPDGWGTRLSAGKGRGYESAEAIAFYRDSFDSEVKLLRDNHARLVISDGAIAGGLLATSEHNGFMTLGYVFALAALGKDFLKVLDYGGSFGNCYFVARALIPDVALDYHCKELPEIARMGRKLTPEITWYEDESCFARGYDLVIFSGSLPYVRNWQDTILRAAQSGSLYFYLTGLAVLEHEETYVAVHRHAGAEILHNQINKAELLATIERAGLRLVREFWVGDHPVAVGAPEQPTSYGCLLTRHT